MSTIVRRMLLISGTPLWSMGEKRGASSFYNTIKGYIDNGWLVDVISSNSTSGLDLDGARIVGRCPQVSAGLRGLVKIGILFRFLDWLVFQFFILIRGGGLLKSGIHDVVYAYEIAGVPASMLLGKFFKKFVVTRFQGTVMSQLQGRFAWRLRYWDHWFALRSQADLVVMANDGTQGDRILRDLGVPDARVRFWMNGLKPLNQNALGSFQLPVAREDFMILAVSRLVSWKRLDRAIGAMPAVLKSMPSARLVIVGDGPHKLIYESLADRLGCTHRVTFIGAVPESQVVHYMRRADIFVSLYDISNVGNPLLEAMVNGLCVVTLNNGDTAKIIENGVNGVMLEESDLGQLPEIIVQLGRDTSMRERLGLAAQAYARKHFLSWDARMLLEVETLESMLQLGAETGDRAADW